MGTRGAASLVVAAVVAVLGAACGAAGPPGPDTAGDAGANAADDLALGDPRPVPDHPDVLTRSGAAGRFLACEGDPRNGGWSQDVGGPPVTVDPDAALQAFLDQGLFDLPSSGWGRAGEGPERVLFTHDVDGRTRAVVIVADVAVFDEPPDATDTGWVMETFATCDPSEFAAATDDELRQQVWTDAAGTRVPTDVVTSYRGPEHCDWESVTILQLGEQQYLRDPDRLLTEEVPTRFEGDVELPPDATDTGYRRGEEQLWLSADGRTAYLVGSAGVEAWPAPRYPVGCA